MTLENQVCSLDLAKRLKELGVKQESYFAWAKQCTGTDPKTHNNIWDYRVMKNDFQAELEFISAFTVAELGEMLPTERLNEQRRARLGGYYFDYEYISCGADTEADARAKMLIYLLENNLVSHAN